jgi:hypothetical protein
MPGWYPECGGPILRYPDHVGERHRRARVQLGEALLDPLAHQRGGPETSCLGGRPDALVEVER